jgi:hypothetical protein
MMLQKNISRLSRELGLDRSMMYIWKRKLEKRAYGNVQAGEVNVRDRQIQELQAKIAGLEGVIGRQALELDFFESALRRIRETAPQSGDKGESTSTPRSRGTANACYRVHRADLQSEAIAFGPGLQVAGRV